MRFGGIVGNAVGCAMRRFADGGVCGWWGMVGDTACREGEL